MEEMTLEEFLDNHHKHDKLLVTNTNQISKKSIKYMLDLMEEHNISKIRIDEIGWFLNIDKTYSNPFAKPEFRTGKIVGNFVENKKGEQGELNSVVTKLNSKYNNYYNNPHITSFDYLKEKMDEISLDSIDRFLQEKNIDFNIFELDFNAFTYKIKEIKEEYLDGDEKKVFLSYNFKDCEIAKKVAVLFVLNNYDSFLDWNDPKLRNRSEITENMIKRIKERIKENEIFVYIVTNGQKNSKWMPWELGLAEGMKKEVYILPIIESKNKKNYDGQEYINVHNHIIFQNGRLQKYKNKQLIEN